MTDTGTTPGWGTTLAWAHALLHGAQRFLLPSRPGGVGDAAWQPRAAAVARRDPRRTRVVLVGAVRSAPTRPAAPRGPGQDVQPVLPSLHPASLEHLERDIGVPWFRFALHVLVVPTVRPAASAASDADAPERHCPGEPVRPQAGPVGAASQPREAGEVTVRLPAGRRRTMPRPRRPGDPRCDPGRCGAWGRRLAAHLSS
jgi:hypothetical protein